MSKNAILKYSTLVRIAPYCTVDIYFLKSHSINVFSNVMQCVMCLTCSQCVPVDHSIKQLIMQSNAERSKLAQTLSNSGVCE